MRVLISLFTALLVTSFSIYLAVGPMQDLLEPLLQYNWADFLFLVELIVLWFVGYKAMSFFDKEPEEQSHPFVAPQRVSPVQERADHLNSAQKKPLVATRRFSEMPRYNPTGDRDKLMQLLDQHDDYQRRNVFLKFDTGAISTNYYINLNTAREIRRQEARAQIRLNDSLPKEGHSTPKKSSKSEDSSEQRHRRTARDEDDGLSYPIWVNGSEDTITPPTNHGTSTGFAGFGGGSFSGSGAGGSYDDDRTTPSHTTTHHSTYDEPTSPTTHDSGHTGSWGSDSGGNDGGDSGGGDSSGDGGGGD